MRRGKNFIICLFYLGKFPRLLRNDLANSPVCLLRYLESSSNRVKGYNRESIAVFLEIIDPKNGIVTQ